MKIISATVQNFGSYKNLSIDFDKGLTLIQGATGSGKSTLCDIVPWIAFGRTAKNGSVDEILSWRADSATSGTLQIEISGERIEITRLRGQKSKTNDLYYCISSGSPIRGKDLTDTQKLINTKLGITAETYLSGAYFHEFSESAQFFTTSAKNRRLITEQMIDLSLATRLTSELTNRRKKLKSGISEIQSEISQKQSLLEYMLNQARNLDENRTIWEQGRGLRLHSLERQSKEFEESRTQTILILTEEAEACVNELKSAPDAIVCPTCGNKPDEVHKQGLDFKIDAILKQVELEEKRKNPYTKQIIMIQNEKNPFISKMNTDEAQARLHLIGLNKAYETSNIDLADIEVLTQVIEDFRVLQVAHVVNELETMTNSMLGEHFDGEIKVLFEAEDKDKLEATIYKDGNIASFTQLSKGQRQMLKLSFGTAVMKCIAQHNGITFNTVFYDEALDGMSDEVRVKAYGIFEQMSLEYENIFVVDHSEAFKACFNNQIVVALKNGESQLQT